MSEYKRVLIFSLAYLPFVGGAELALKHITDRIRDIEFDLITLRFDRSLPREEKIGRVRIYRIGFGKQNPTMEELSRFPMYFNKVLFPFLAFFKAVQLHRRCSYNAVWAMMSYAGFPAIFFKWRYPRVPFVLTLQEGDPIAHITERARIRAVFPLYRAVLGFEEIKEIYELEKEKLRCFHGLFGRLLREKERLTVSECLECLIRETQYDFYVLSLPQGKRHFANLRKLIDMAKDLENREAIHLGDFVRYVRGLETQEVRESEAQVEAEEGERVGQRLVLFNPDSLLSQAKTSLLRCKRAACPRVS